MANKLQIRGGTASAATSANPLLNERELGIETDTKKVKLGDGTTLYNDLDYLALEINWLGEFATAPGSPARNDAYYDTTLGEARIYSGSQWDTLAKDGLAGGPVPAGGTTGQVIVKQSATEGDVDWEDIPGFTPPIGWIAMFSGTWVDNVTLPGWYACIAANAGQGCPDLENTFIKGSAPADVGTTGGSNTHTLTEAELPIHAHGIDHDHGAASTGNHRHSAGDSTSSGTDKNTLYSRIYASLKDWFVGYSTVSVNLPAYSGTGGDTGSGNAHNNEPAYYKLIYIRKCS